MYENVTHEMPMVENDGDHALQRLEDALKEYNTISKFRLIRRRSLVIVIEGALLELQIAEARASGRRLGLSSR